MGLFDWLKGGNDRNKNKSSVAGQSARKPAKDFSAVEVIPAAHGSCSAARAIAGKRFLTKETPLLPLRDCNRDSCDCSYRRHPDRRHKVRRAGDLGASVTSKTLVSENDRRDPNARGRRATDRSPGQS